MSNSKAKPSTSEMRMDLDTLSQVALSQFDTSLFNQPGGATASKVLLPSSEDPLSLVTTSMAVTGADLFGGDQACVELPNLTGTYFAILQNIFLFSLIQFSNPAQLSLGFIILQPCIEFNHCNHSRLRIHSTTSIRQALHSGIVLCCIHCIYAANTNQCNT